MKRFLLAMTAVSILFGASIGQAAPRTETARYELGPIGDNFLFCGGIGVSTPAGTITVVEGGNYGGACFATQPGDATVSVMIADDIMPAVGLTVGMYNAAGGLIGNLVPGCVGVQASVPAGTSFVGVYADGLVFGTLDCGLPLTATSGEITATFA